MKIGIVAGGPADDFANLQSFREDEIYWIGADRGALYLIENGIKPDLAIGDFDSINSEELSEVAKHSKVFEKYPIEKDETDLELALLKAYEQASDKILLFGVTGGRMDHTLINIQLLYQIMKKGMDGAIVNKGNIIELKLPGKHIVEQDPNYDNISFVPFTPSITGLSLNGFYYPLQNRTIEWGSTLCISNKLLSEKGTFSFTDGILLVIKSRDV